MSKMFNSENHQRFVINQDRDKLYPLHSLMNVVVAIKDDICYGYNIIMVLDNGCEILLGSYDTQDAAMKEIDRIFYSDHIYETVMEDDYDLYDEDYLENDEINMEVDIL